MTDLSPAAQYIVNAAVESGGGYGRATPVLHARLAAALRAAAEIVAPLSYEDVWTDGRILQYEKHDSVREKLLAIADELEGAK
jgi:hypothetical protein